MADQGEIPAFPEIDEHGGDDLPSYDDLAAQNGPNSRFGRWREWIEKRAAERYADLSPDDLKQRKKRGWELEDSMSEQATLVNEAGSSSQLSHPNLHIQTTFEGLTQPVTSPSQPPSRIAPLPALPSVGEIVSPTHLRVHHFGSRFLPHTTSQIRCLLPILNDRLLLIGHDDGLSVLDMYPKEWTESGLTEKGPSDAEARPVWVGEGVHQLDIIEAENLGNGTPQGVVLALVGPDTDSPKDHEGIRTLRMYNLSSLVNLAKWAAVQKGSRPLDLRHPASGKPIQATTSPKKHKHKGSQAKLRALTTESPTSITPLVNKIDPFSPYSSSYASQSLTNTSQSPPFRGSALRTNSSQDSFSTVDSSWDLVEDVPLRWATDFVPVATAGSRLENIPVISYALWRSEHTKTRGGSYLAIAVKNNIFLYETPKGERAFRVLKEFYTPLNARSLHFVMQAVADPMSRSPSDVSPRQNSQRHGRHQKILSMSNRTTSQYPHQLTLFAIFEKKAGLIRIADSAVGEVELYDECMSLTSLTLPRTSLSPPMGSTRRARSSWDGIGFIREHKAPWLPPVHVIIPGPLNQLAFSQQLYILTRGKHSHFLPYPLPANISSTPPYRSIIWSTIPNHVCARICRPPSIEEQPFLQVIAYSDDGLEIHEINLSTLTISGRKHKAKAEEAVRGQTDIGGDTGFLCLGGNWQKSGGGPMALGGAVDLERAISTMSVDSTGSAENYRTADGRAVYSRTEQGFYGWVRKGHDDWRVIWVGGDGTLDPA